MQLLNFTSNESFSILWVKVSRNTNWKHLFLSICEIWIFLLKGWYYISDISRKINIYQLYCYNCNSFISSICMLVKVFLSKLLPHSFPPRNLSFPTSTSDVGDYLSIFGAMIHTKALYKNKDVPMRLLFSWNIMTWSIY